MMDLKKVIIESERLVLRPLDEKYAGIIFMEFTPQVTKYMYPCAPGRIDETIDYISSAVQELEEGSHLPMVIHKKENSEFIGCVGLRGIGADDPKLGIWTKESSHGNGFGIEAANALIKWTRDNIEHTHIRYPVDKRNMPSRRIPERNNGRIMREFKKINQAGFELDEYEYWI